MKAMLAIRLMIPGMVQTIVHSRLIIETTIGAH